MAGFASTDPRSKLDPAVQDALNGISNGTALTPIQLKQLTDFQATNHGSDAEQRPKADPLVTATTTTTDSGTGGLGGGGSTGTGAAPATAAPALAGLQAAAPEAQDANILPSGPTTLRSGIGARQGSPLASLAMLGLRKIY